MEASQKSSPSEAVALFILMKYVIMLDKGNLSPPLPP